MNFAKFLRSPFLQNTSWRLLLKGLFMSGNKMFPLHPSGFYLYTTFFSFYKVLPPISQECLLISQECLLNFYFREKCHSKTLFNAFQKTLEAVAQRCSLKIVKFTGNWSNWRWSLCFNKVAVTLNKLCTLIYISLSRFKSGKPISGPAFLSLNCQ